MFIERCAAKIPNRVQCSATWRQADGRLAGHHRLDAVWGHLLEMSGDYEAAVAKYRAAAAQTGSSPEREYLLTQAARVAESMEEQDRGQGVARRSEGLPHQRQ